jgi:hypothetical protein
VDEFDLTEFPHMLVDHCVELLQVEAAGVLLSDQRGGIRMAAASSEKAELLAVFAADTAGGPCVDCVRSGAAVGSRDLRGDADRWPRYAAAAVTPAPTTAACPTWPPRSSTAPPTLPPSRHTTATDAAT